ncbi:MAG: ATP synthase F1 subunit delta [Nitrospiraceae bacterium]|nr:ATP synthase F1 subunit delta [Nitrospiraceae bacterium]
MKKNKRLEKQFAKKFLNHVGRQNLGALQELGAVGELVGKAPELKGFLEGPQFSAGEKKGVMEELCSKLQVSDGTRKFLEYAIDQEAMPMFGGIVEDAVKLYLDYTRRTKAVVVSAVDFPAGGALENRLKGSLKKLTGRDVDIEYVRDPSVLGGVLVKVDSTMFDSSLKGQLRLLKEELIKG